MSQEPTTASARPIRLSIGNSPTPPSRTGDAAVGGIVAVVAEHEQFARRHRHLGRVVEPAIVAHLEDRMADAVRAASRHSDRPARCRRGRPRPRRRRRASACAAWSLMKSWPCRIWMRSPGRPTTRLTHACERSPGQRNTTTSPRFGVSPNSASGLRQRDLDRQRGGAVAVREFRRHQRVADQERRLHRARRHVERFGDRALGDEHHGDDRGQLRGLRAPARRLGCGCLAVRLTSPFLQP